MTEPSRIDPNVDTEILSSPRFRIATEQQILGALLINNSLFEQIQDLLEERNFSRDEHQRIWRHIARVISEKQPADVVTVAKSLEQSGDLSKARGLSYLFVLAVKAPASSGAPIRHYAELLRKHTLPREETATASEFDAEQSDESTELMRAFAEFLISYKNDIDQDTKAFASRSDEFGKIILAYLKDVVLLKGQRDAVS